MLKDQKEDENAVALYETLKEDNGISHDALQEAVLAILRLETQETKSPYKKFHEKFQTLYLNKMTHSSPTKSAQQYSHTPSLNANSVRLAEKSRERRKQLIKEATNGNVSKPSIVDLLMIVKKTQEEKTEAKRHKKSEEETKECTFHPEVANKRSASKDKCISLYDMSKSAKKKTGKTTEEIEYEKSKEELLFTPRLSK